MPQLQLPELPESIAYLWEWYCELQNGTILSWCEIKAWKEVTLTHVTPEESQVLRMLSEIHNKINNTPPEN